MQPQALDGPFPAPLALGSCPATLRLARRMLLAPSRGPTPAPVSGGAWLPGPCSLSCRSPGGTHAAPLLVLRAAEARCPAPKPPDPLGPRAFHTSGRRKDQRVGPAEHGMGPGNAIIIHAASVRVSERVCYGPSTRTTPGHLSSTESLSTIKIRKCNLKDHVVHQPPGALHSTDVYVYVCRGGGAGGGGTALLGYGGHCSAHDAAPGRRRRGEGRGGLGQCRAKAPPSGECRTTRAFTLVGRCNGNGMALCPGRRRYRAQCSACAGAVSALDMWSSPVCAPPEGVA